MYALHKFSNNKNLAGDDHIIKCILRKSVGKKSKKKWRWTEEGVAKHLLEKNVVTKA